MTQHQHRSGRATTTLLVLGAAALVVRGNAQVFEMTGNVDGVFVAGGVSLFFVAGVARLHRRFSLVPAESVIAVAALLIALTWAFPMTPRTRFFTDTRQIRVGMTVPQVRARLSRYREHCFVRPGSFPVSREAAEVVSDPCFSGNLEYKPQHRTSDFSNFRIKNGRVTDIFHYVD